MDDAEIVVRVQTGVMGKLEATKKLKELPEAPSPVSSFFQSLLK